MTKIAREDDKVYVLPRNENEVQLILIWETILGVKSISIDENFFELGGIP